MMMLAPIVLFCYNRPKHTEQTLIALNNNLLADQSQLFVFCDGPKINATNEQKEKIALVRDLVKSKKWCKEVVIYESEVNKGLANSVIEGTTKIVNEYGRIIVLEDDLITSKGFLKYMNDALNRYATCENVFQISAHCFPAKHISKKNQSFFIPLTTSWGWGTWKRAWDNFDIQATDYELLKTDIALKDRFNLGGAYPYANMLIHQMEIKDIDSWAIRWWWSVFKKNGLVLFPDRSLVKNTGFGDEGTHTKVADPFPIVNFDSNYFIKKFPTIIASNEVYFNEMIDFIKNPASNQFQKKEKLPFFYKIAKRFYHLFN